MVLLGLVLTARAALALAPAPEVPAPEVSAPEVSTPQVPTPPAGSPAGPPLEWIAPPTCPDADRGAEHLARFLGGRPPTAPARVELTAGEAGHTATITVSGATRTLQASDCDTLARAAALVVAVSLDPVAAAVAVLGEGEGETEPPIESADDELDVPPPALEPAPSERRRRTASRRADMPPRAEPGAAAPRTAHWLGASGGVALALVPALTGAVRLGYAYERGALRVQAQATYATPRTLTYPAEPDVGGRFQSVALGASACFAPAAGRVAVPLCGGLEGGPIVGRGLGVTSPRSPVGAWLGALAGGSVVVRLSPRLALTAGADLLVSLRRPAFHVGARETLFRAPLVGLRAVAGLALRVW